MSDNRNYLPDHYTEVSEPFFEGRGNHSVMKLEEICEQYKEFTHQLQIKFQNASQQTASLREENERLKASIATGERLRMSDAHCAINESNQLRAKVEEQELIIHGITEGAGEWESLANDRKKMIGQLQEEVERVKELCSNQVGGFVSVKEVLEALSSKESKPS